MAKKGDIRKHSVKAKQLMIIDDRNPEDNITVSQIFDGQHWIGVSEAAKSNDAIVSQAAWEVISEEQANSNPSACRSGATHPACPASRGKPQRERCGQGQERKRNDGTRL